MHILLMYIGRSLPNTTINPVYVTCQISLMHTTDVMVWPGKHSLCYKPYTWWRHQMETFSALLAICAGNSSVTGEFPTQRPVTGSFDAFFDPRLYKRLNKQSYDWWFDTASCPLWRHCNEDLNKVNMYRRIIISICIIHDIIFQARDNFEIKSYLFDADRCANGTERMRISLNMTGDIE